MANPVLLRGRTSQVGGYYCVTTVVHHRNPVLAARGSADIIRSELHRTAEEGTAETFAWVLMPDHLHWLFQLQHGSPGRCMQRFKSRSARALNLQAGSSGRFWQGGYYDHLLRSDDDLLKQARCLVENPLRKGLVTRIEDYPFWWCRWISSSSDLV